MATNKQANKATEGAPASRARKDSKALPVALRGYREKAGLTPKELAEKIGGDWSASTVRRIERGARNATDEQQAQLAAALNVPADWLFGKPNAKRASTKAPAAKVVGKRTGKVLASRADVQDEIGAILGT